MSSEDEASIPQLERPCQTTILERWTSFFADPLLSYPHLKSAAISGAVASRGLRSLHWRYFFSLLPSPSAPTSSTTSTYSLILNHSRSEYSELRSRLLRSPDGGWVNDGSSSAASNRPDGPKDGTDSVGVQVNNPLGLDSGNPWSAWFEDLELRRTIRQDVQRTFPEIDYFREPATQDKMVDLLFIWSKLTPEIGYRQGMHELLAPLLWTVDFDSLLSPADATQSLAHLVLSREHVEHDTWQLFSALMKSAKTFYDFTPSVPLAVDKSSTSASTTSVTLSQSKGLNGQASTPSSSIVLVQPIVGTAIRIHDSLLKTIDHDLWAKMEELGIEPQIFGIRWLRLIFSREFPIDDALALWDGLFAEDSSLRLMEHICIAMLLRIRDALLQADYSEFLQLLLRYPALPDGTHRISLILQQAIYLRDNVSADAGERCRGQNIQVGAIAGGDIVRGQDTVRRRSSSQMGRAGHRKSSSMSPATQAGGFLAEGGFVGDLAKGVYGRAEALGINKAIFGTFNEIKRGVAQAQAAQAAQAQANRNGMSEIPNRLPWDSKPPPPPANKDYLAEIGKMRQTSLAMSNAIDLCVNVLQQEVVIGKPRPKDADAEEGVTSDGAADEHPLPSGETIMALTALCHIRDVLAGKARTFDSSVLSPLTNALESGVFPPSNHPPPSPDLASPPSPVPSPQPPPPPSLVAPSLAAPAPIARPMARSSSTETSSPSTSVGTPSTGPSTPPLFLSARTDKPLPSLTRTPQLTRPIPPWESSRLGSSVKTTLPQPPPSIPSTSAVPAGRGQATFPSTSFSTRVGQRKTSVGADPLGAIHR